MPSHQAHGWISLKPAFRSLWYSRSPHCPGYFTHLSNFFCKTFGFPRLFFVHSGGTEYFHLTRLVVTQIIPTGYTLAAYSDKSSTNRLAAKASLSFCSLSLTLQDGRYDQ